MVKLYRITSVMLHHYSQQIVQLARLTEILEPKRFQQIVSLGETEQFRAVGSWTLSNNDEQTARQCVANKTLLVIDLALFHRSNLMPKFVIQLLPLPF